MFKSILIAGLFLSANVLALENEDCKFEDGLGYEVTEVKVSCADKKAEYTYTNDSEEVVVFEIDLPVSPAIDLSQIENGLEYIDHTGYLIQYWSNQPPEECNETDFIPEETLFVNIPRNGFDLLDIGKNYLIDANRNSDGTYKILSVQNRWLRPVQHRCWGRMYLNNDGSPYIYYGQFGLHEDQREAVLVDNNPDYTLLADAMRKYRKKYYGEFRAVPLND